MPGGFAVAWGGVAVLVGALAYRYAEAVADFDEKTDSIGSGTPFEEAEAAKWKRTVYRAGAASIILGGLALAAYGLV